MVRELIYFDLHLGPRTDEFKLALKRVQEAMADLGVVVGRTWGTMTGEARTIILEREFDSLTAYEQDDARFHGAKEFMPLWRELESTLKGMRVEVWQN